MTLIELFEVPPSADATFVAEWENERGNGTLYRALRDDVPVRFVGITPDGGSYELIHEDGVVDAPGGVTLIEPRDVPVEAVPEFLHAWEEVRRAAATHRGYLGTRLYRSDCRFVTVARWSSPLMVARALPGRPGLYQPHPPVGG